MEFPADRQADSPLGGGVDIWRDTIRDRFVPLGPHEPTRERLTDFSCWFDGLVCAPHRDFSRPTVHDYEGRLCPECSPS